MNNVALKSYKSQYDPAVTLYEKIEDIEQVSRSFLAPTGNHGDLKSGTPEITEIQDVKLETETHTCSEVVTEFTPRKNTRLRKRKEAPAHVADGDNPSSTPRKSKVIRLSLDIPHPAPENWEEVYAAIKEMRKNGGAPVDEMGCHMAGGPVEDPKTKRFMILISLMLSSQTKDQVTHAAVTSLRAALGELTAENLAAADDTVVSDAINKVGFWRRKTQYIKQAALRILDEFDGEIPDTLQGLCSLPGIGPKMAFLALQVAWNRSEGIGVDVHVHRITNRLGWHKPPTKEPEQTRLNLQSWLPNELHSDINPLLVGFGQTICLPVGPRCDVCTLSNGLCPSAVVKTKLKARRGRSESARAKIQIEVEHDKEIVLEECVKTEYEVVDADV